MEKSCCGCGNKLFGYSGNVVVCGYCGQRIFFQNTLTDFLGVNFKARPKTEILKHILMFLFTLGIGNIIYIIRRKKQFKREKYKAAEI